MIMLAGKKPAVATSLPYPPPEESKFMREMVRARARATRSVASVVVARAGVAEAAHFDGGLVEDLSLSEGLGGVDYGGFKQFVTAAVNQEFEESVE